MNNNDPKKIVRKKYKDMMKEYSRTDLTQRSAKIVEYIKKSYFYAKKETIAFYASTDHEVSLRELFLQSLIEKKRSVFPKYSGENKLSFYRVLEETDLDLGAFGILEPLLHCEYIQTNAIDVFLVPGVCFDSCGNRIGSGLGCYDEALRGAKQDALFIGIAYSFQMSKTELPTRKEDIPMHYVATEDAIIKSNQGHTKIKMEVIR